MPPTPGRGPSFDVQMGDVVRLRKPHPCGSYDWQIVRIGADIGLKCVQCGRRVLLDRGTFNKRVKALVRREGEERKT